MKCKYQSDWYRVWKKTQQQTSLVFMYQYIPTFLYFSHYIDTITDKDVTNTSSAWYIIIGIANQRLLWHKIQRPLFLVCFSFIWYYMYSKIKCSVQKIAIWGVTLSFQFDIYLFTKPSNDFEKWLTYPEWMMIGAASPNVIELTLVRSWSKVSIFMCRLASPHEVIWKWTNLRVSSFCEIIKQNL